MKLQKIFAPWLKDYKWFRRKIGGKWYKVRVTESLGGFDEPVSVWMKERPSQEHVVIKTETYADPQRETSVSRNSAENSHANN